jgi:predicted dehydrogenase
VSKHLLIVGSGSVGKRHARNLAALGCRISCMDPRPDRRAELVAETPCVGSFATLEDALAAGRLDGVVIGSPPAVHVVQTTAALAAGLPVLLEKPVSPDLVTTRALRDAAASSAVPVLLGYTWRWWPPLARVRELLAKDVIGNVRHVQFQMSAHLADWHPWERYQDFFMASKALGGGALLDESHWSDLALWLFGQPDYVFARVEKLSDLQIDTDDNVDMLWRYDGARGPRIGLHLDIFGRPHEKFIRFSGERGTLLWTPDPNRIRWGKGMAGWEFAEEFGCERNEMFVAVAREFLDVLAGARPSCTLDDGVNVMQVVEAARRSHTQCREIALGELA